MLRRRFDYQKPPRGPLRYRLAYVTGWLLHWTLEARPSWWPLRGASPGYLIVIAIFVVFAWSWQGLALAGLVVIALEGMYRNSERFSRKWYWRAAEKHSADAMGAIGMMTLLQMVEDLPAHHKLVLSQWIRERHAVGDDEFDATAPGTPQVVVDLFERHQHVPEEKQWWDR